MSEATESAAETVKEVTEQDTTASAYDRLANTYRNKKINSMYNMLECGKILHDVKQSLGYGVWCQFLKDNRVCESERTAHRMLSIYKNYRHLLTENCLEKAGNLAQLGISHLLEFQKLPDRFKKEVEIIKETPDGEVKELQKVIDEEKLNDFLEQPVNHQGEQKAIRDLPLNEMKKYINEAKGVYEPEEIEDSETENSHEPEQENSQSDNLPDIGPAPDEPGADEPEVAEDKTVTEEKTEKKQDVLQTNHDNKVKQLSIQLRATSQNLLSQFNEFDKTYYDYVDQKRKEAVVAELDRLRQVCETIIVKSDEIKEQLND